MRQLNMMLLVAFALSCFPLETRCQDGDGDVDVRFSVRIGEFDSLYVMRNKTAVYGPFANQSPKDGLIGALEYYGVKHPEIVEAQAKLETGNYKSVLCRRYNNLFGLRDWKTKGYMHFSHWTESVIAYRDKVQYKFREGEETYYQFLDRIGYAEDTTYIRKVMNIVQSSK